MDFIQLAAARYSCRSYTGQPVSREDLDACAKAACLAPSARNSQPWRIILVDDPEVVAKVREQTSDEELKLNLFTQKAMAFAVFAEETAMSASCSAVGSIFMAQSANTATPSGL